MSTRSEKYNSAKTWQVGCFVLNNGATQLYGYGMGFISYYAAGIAGLLVVIVSSIITSMRIFDGVTDPIIGYIVDKTSTKFGRFRPFMILGNLIMAISMLLIYNTTHLVPESFRLIYFTLIYCVYIIGFTFQTTITKAGQNVLTNHPKQRPLLIIFNGLNILFIYNVLQMVISSYMVPYFGDFTMAFFRVMPLIIIGLSALFTFFACLGIKEKDNEQYYEIQTDAKPIRFRDYWPVFKQNRALRLLIYSAATDKLGMFTMKNSITYVMLFGIIFGNYALSGKMGLITAIPSFIIGCLGSKLAQKFGNKRALVGVTWTALITATMFIALVAFGDVTTISLTAINFTTIVFLVLFTILMGLSGTSDGIVITMVADCADYQYYISGQFIPGMISSIFSFIDKVFSSLSNTIIGFCLAAIGFKEAFPTVNTPFSNEILYLTIFFFVGIPMIGWIISLIAMKFYPLDDKMMEQVRAKVTEAQLNKEGELTA